MVEKFKSFLANDAYFYTVMLILVGVASFGLGRLSVTDNSHAMSSTDPLQALSSVERNDSISTETALVVVSKSGSKYHLLDCPGAQQIKLENRIEFPSIDEAKAAGYTAAGNCPGI